MEELPVAAVLLVVVHELTQMAALVARRTVELDVLESDLPPSCM